MSGGGRESRAHQGLLGRKTIAAAEQGAPSPEELRRVERAFLSLGAEDQQLLLMLRADGLGYPEIAQRLGISVPEVQHRVAGLILAWCKAMERQDRPSQNFVGRFLRWLRRRPG